MNGSWLIVLLRVKNIICAERIISLISQLIDETRIFIADYKFKSFFQQKMPNIFCFQPLRCEELVAFDWVLLL